MALHHAHEFHVEEHEQFSLTLQLSRVNHM